MAPCHVFRVTPNSIAGAANTALVTLIAIISKTSMLFLYMTLLLLRDVCLSCMLFPERTSTPYPSTDALRMLECSTPRCSDQLLP